MSVDTRVLSHQAQLARALVQNLRDIGEDDDQLFADMVEGETELTDIVERAMDRVSEIDAMLVALKTRRDDLAERADRLSDQAAKLKTAVQAALETAGLQRMELPACTLSLRRVPPKVEVVDITELPSEYLIPQPPKVDRRALLAKLKETTVPGALLSNPHLTLSIRSR